MTDLEHIRRRALEALDQINHRRLDRLHRKRAEEIIDHAPLTVGEAHAILWPERDLANANRSLARLLSKVNALGRLRIEVDGAKRLGTGRTIRIFVHPSAKEMGA